MLDAGDVAEKNMELGEEVIKDCCKSAWKAELQLIQYQILDSRLNLGSPYLRIPEIREQREGVKLQLYFPLSSSAERLIKRWDKVSFSKKKTSLW